MIDDSMHKCIRIINSEVERSVAVQMNVNVHPVRKNTQESDLPHVQRRTDCFLSSGHSELREFTGIFDGGDASHQRIV